MLEIKKLYNISKAAKIGENLKCPSCGNIFIKQYYQQSFCLAKLGTKCKDKYWNTIDENKRNNKTRISPASSAWLLKNDTPIVYGYGDSQREIDKQDRLELELEFDGTWDAHYAYVERCKWCECLICKCED